MEKHELIDYIEIPSRDLNATKQFFETVFGWKFQDYGAEYTSFRSEKIEGGFYKSEKQSATEQGATLVIFYSETLETTLEKIAKAGGTITKPVFEFPGGKRFHFTEPGGSEFAVWSDQ